MDGTPIIRPAARALIIDSSNCLLLFHNHDPTQEEPELWITPGGALEEGESFEQALRRELWEETGLASTEVGPWVWSRRHIWRWGTDLYDTRERFYLVRVDSLTLQLQYQTPLERQVMIEHRWWSIPEIQSAPDSEVFVPRRLGELLMPIIAGDLPKTPLEVGH